ncbi:MAG: sensor histidine kinase [Butyricicoccaceae bacterium]
MSRDTDWRHSIRFKFFISIAVIAVGFIGLLLVLNVLFFKDYYQLAKKRSLVNVYETVNQCYGNVSDETFANRMQQLEERYSVKIDIGGLYGEYIYSTSAHQNQDFMIPMIQTRRLMYYYYDEDELAHKGYTFASVLGTVDEKEYIALIGRLSGGEQLIARVPAAAIEENRSFNLVFLSATGLLALLVCLGLGYYVAGWFTKPLQEMTRTANALARMDFSQKVPERGGQDELSQLGSSINQMSDHLEQSIRDLQEMNQQLEAEIRKKQQIDDMRKEFIINVSHELKTPIALIQGYAEGLRVGISGSEEDKNYYCDIIIDEAKRMNQMVIQLLALSRLELGNTPLHYTEVELYDLAESVVSKTRVMWEEKGLSIDLSGIGDQVVSGDYEKLEQVVTNYMTNAIDHTPPGGAIALRSSEDAQHYIFCVRNQGAPISEEDQQKIWDKFYKTDKARTRITGGGTGIGLSIVRAVMNAHQGGCGVRNVEDGVEFYFTLPKHAERPSGEAT